MKTKLSIGEVENLVSQVVSDYVECRIGIGDLLKGINKLGEYTQDLIKAKKKYVAALIDIVNDNLIFEMDQDTYNPRDPGTTEKYIDWYYGKYIKNKK